MNELLDSASHAGSAIPKLYAIYLLNLINLVYLITINK